MTTATANPKPDTSQALVAGVRAGNIESFSKLADYLADLINDHALIERDLSDLRPKYAALAEENEKLRKTLELIRDEEYAYDEMPAVAGDLLAKLAEVKTT